MQNLPQNLNIIKAIHKELKNADTYKNSIFLQIIKNGKVDTKRLKDFGLKNSNLKYVEDVLLNSEELEDRGILIYDENSSTFNFVNQEQKEKLYKEVLNSIEEFKKQTDNKSTQTKNNSDMVIKNSYIQDNLRNSYESLDFSTLKEKQNFIKSMTYFNNFSFNNIINLHAQQVEKKDEFLESTRYYKTFSYFKKEGTRVLKGSKALRVFVPKKIPLYEKDSQGSFIEKNGKRVPLKDEKGNNKYATTFSMTNIFSFDQTNFDINYADADMGLVAKQLAEKTDNIFNEATRGDINYIAVLIREELNKLSDDKTVNYLATYILMNRLGIELENKNINDDFLHLNKNDFLTLTREVNAVAKSFERKHNFDEILKNATIDVVEDEVNILTSYENLSREKKIKHVDILDKEIKDRVIKIKEQLDISNYVKFDTIGNATGSNIIGVSIFGIEDTFKPLESFIQEIKESDDYKYFENEKDNKELDILVKEVKKDIKSKDVFIKSEDKQVTTIEDIKKSTSSKEIIEAEVYGLEKELYSEYSSANKFKEDLNKGANEVNSVSKSTKLEKIKEFIGKTQHQIISSTAEFNDTIDDIYNVVSNMPKTYATEDLDESEKMVKLHYFNENSDWYIIEKDISQDQHQAFGYVVLNGDLQNAELGYISIKELKKLDIELDFHWEEKSLLKLKQEIHNKAEGILGDSPISQEYLFIKKYFQISDENIAILKEFLQNDTQELPNIDNPAIFYTGLINANVMEDNDTYMTAFKNLKNLYLQEQKQTDSVDNTKLYLANVSIPNYNDFDAIDNWDIYTNVVINKSEHNELEENEYSCEIIKEITQEEAKNYKTFKEAINGNKERDIDTKLISLITDFSINGTNINNIPKNTKWEDAVINFENADFVITTDNGIIDVHWGMGEDVEVKADVLVDEELAVAFENASAVELTLENVFNHFQNLKTLEEIYTINELNDDGTYYITLKYTNADNEVFREIETEATKERVLSLIGTTNPNILMEHLEEKEKVKIFNSLQDNVEKLSAIYTDGKIIEIEHDSRVFEVENDTYTLRFLQGDDGSSVVGFKNNINLLLYKEQEDLTLDEKVEYFHTKAQDFGFNHRILELYSTIEELKYHYGTEWKEKLNTMWETGDYDTKVNGIDLQFLRNQLPDFENIYNSLELYNTDTKAPLDIEQDKEVLLSICYPFMSNEDKEEYQDILDSKINSRLTTIVNVIYLESKEQCLEFIEFETTKNDTNNIGMTAFGVKDDFEPIDEYIKKIKNSSEYKTYANERFINYIEELNSSNETIHIKIDGKEHIPLEHKISYEDDGTGNTIASIYDHDNNFYSDFVSYETKLYNAVTDGLDAYNDILAIEKSLLEQYVNNEFSWTPLQFATFKQVGYDEQGFIREFNTLSNLDKKAILKMENLIKNGEVQADKVNKFIDDLHEKLVRESSFETIQDADNNGSLSIQQIGNEKVSIRNHNTNKELEFSTRETLNKKNVVKILNEIVLNTTNEYLYATNNRPPSLGAVPNGFKVVDSSKKKFRYGVISYDRALNLDELNNFEMTDLTQEHFNYVSDKIVKSMGKYADKYLENEKELKDKINTVINKSYSMSIDLERYDELVELVKDTIKQVETSEVSTFNKAQIKRAMKEYPIEEKINIGSYTYMGNVKQVDILIDTKFDRDNPNELKIDMGGGVGLASLQLDATLVDYNFSIKAKNKLQELVKEDDRLVDTIKDNYYDKNTDKTKLKSDLDELLKLRTNIIKFIEKEQALTEIFENDPHNILDIQANPKQTNDVEIKTEKIGAKTKFKRNVVALEVIERLDNGANVEDLEKEDLVKLSKYTGWGGIPQAFRKFNGEITKGWEKEVDELETLLPKEKLEEIRKTILTAFYTPTQISDGVIRAIEDMGYNGYGNILEPSVGIGNILSSFTNTVNNGSKIDAIEMDKTTSKITKALFPNVNVATQPFQDVEIKDGKYNLIVGNPPFGDIKIGDDDNDLNLLSLHNYFLAKSSKKLAEGGIMAMVVSSSLMDAQDKRAREVIANTCNLVGAIRLPNNAFTDTEVTTDVLFFQKRTPNMTSNSDEWLDVSEFNETPINKYYTNNRDKLLGTWGKFGTMYGGGQPALVSDKKQDTLKLFNDLISTLPKNIYSKNLSSVEYIDEVEELIEYQLEEQTKLAEAKDYTYAVIDDKLLMKLYNVPNDGKVVAKPVKTKTNSKGERVPLKDTEIERLKAIVEVVDIAEELKNTQLKDNVDDMELNSLRATLNTKYDAFVKKYRYLNADTNKRVFKEDSRFAFALSLEKEYTKAITKTEAKKKEISPIKETAKKSDIFSIRTQYPYKLPTSAKNSLDALTISMGEKGAINLRYMSKLTGFTQDKIIDDLVIVDAIYKDPSQGWVTKDEYLSGNVKKKLKEALEERNIRALEKVIPIDLEAHEIVITCGASWLPEKYMSDFAKYISQDEEAHSIYVPTIATWKMRCDNGSLEADMKYSTDRRTISQILEAGSNNTQIKIYDKQFDGSMKLNVMQTQLANDKVDIVREEFKKWIYKDDERREVLVNLYNEKFNTTVERKYDGDILPLRGQSENIELRKHQKDFVRKFVEGKGINLADHSVGTGKTFTAQTCVMEAKRMGRANKALVVVPNHLTEQWGSEWLELYPNANILIATKKDFTKNERPIFLNRIATGQWDAVVIGHSQLSKIGVSKEFQEEYIKSEISELVISLKTLEERDGKSFTSKQVENRIQKLEEKLKQLVKKPIDTTIEDLGLDMVVVDESHKFKNLAYTTSLTSVGSLGNPSGSQRAEDLYLKTKSLLNRTNGRNLLFLTGTPISNSIAEMYTVQRYLQYDVLKDLGLTHFDSWAKQYAEVVTDFELKPNGQFEPKARLSKFNNVPDLMQMYKSFADVVTRDEVLADAKLRGIDLQIPKVKGSKPTNVVLDRSDLQAELIGIEDEDGNYNENSLIDRAIKMQGQKPEKGKDNILVIINDSKQIALDPRIKNANYPDNPNSKVNVMIEHSLELYKKYEVDKGAMLIFCDMSIPKANVGAEQNKLKELFKLAEDGNDDERLKAEAELDKMSTSEIDAILSNNTFSVYDDIKEKLILKGIPEREIAFIHDAKTDIQKQSLFEKVRKGDIRYLLGSTSKMGEGMNVQERLCGLFHLDAPWRPSDIEQREGRIIRQGNKLYEKHGEDFEVVIERFATKGTLDSTMWETLERKQLSIEQIKQGSAKNRTVEDISGESATMADMKASASGNPFILEEVMLKKEIRKIENLAQEHDRLQYKTRDKIKLYKSIIDGAEETLDKLEIDTENASAYLERINKNQEENEIIDKENRRIKAQNKDIKKENTKLARENKELKLLLEVKPLLPTFYATFNGVELTDRVETGDRIDKIIGKLVNGSENYTKENIKFGEFNISFEYNKDTFNLFNSTIVVNVEGQSDYNFEAPSTTIGAGFCTRIKNKLERVELEYRNAKYHISNTKEELPQLENALSEFEREDELDVLRRRYALVTNSLKYKKDEYHQEAVKSFTKEKIETLEDLPCVYTVSMLDENGNSVLERNVMTDNQNLAVALYKNSITKEQEHNANLLGGVDRNKEPISSVIVQSVNNGSLDSIENDLYHNKNKIDYIDPFYDLDDFVKKQKSDNSSTLENKENNSKRYKN